MGVHYIKLWMILGIWVLITFKSCSVYGYSKTPKQYHIQTDEGPDRYFRFQTYNGQYRKEKRFDDGTVVGTYGWVDTTGLLRLYDYIADTLGYRIVRQRTMEVPPVVEPPAPPPRRTSSSFSPHQGIQRQNIPSQPSLSSSSSSSSSLSPSSSSSSPSSSSLSPSTSSFSPSSSSSPSTFSPNSHTSTHSGTPVQHNARPFPPDSTKPHILSRPTSATLRPQAPDRVRPSRRPPLVARPVSIPQGPQDSDRVRPVVVRIPQPLNQFQLDSSLLKPVSLPVKVTQTIPIPQPNQPNSPKLNPILVPLSQRRAQSQPLVRVQLPAALSQQRLRPIPIPSPVEVESTSSEEDSQNSVTFVSASGVEANRRRFRGGQQEKQIVNSSRGTTRFKGAPISDSETSLDTATRPRARSGATRRRGSIRFQDTAQSQNIDQQNTRFGERKRSRFSPASSIPVDNVNGRNIEDADTSESRISRTENVISNSHQVLPGKAITTGDLTSQGTNTNSGATFDLPPDLPYTINYDLGNQFHMEKTLPDGTKVGKHGYVDPLGILRVTYYSTGPNGHEEKKENKWVGSRHPEQQQK